MNRCTVPADTLSGDHDETPTSDDYKWVEGAGRPRSVPPEEDSVPQDGQPEEMEAGRAQHPPQYAE